MSDKLEPRPATLQSQGGPRGRERAPRRTAHKANTHALRVPSHANTEVSSAWVQRSCRLFGNAGLRSAPSSGALCVIFI